MALAVRRWKPFNVKVSWPLWNRGLTIATVAAGLLLAALIVLHPFTSPRPDGRLHVDFLDVGQGDAALITFPGGETMLVDGGGRHSYRKADEAEEPFEPDVRRVGEAVVSETLWANGLSDLDYIVATHADADHVQGLTDIVKNFRVGRALFGRLPANDPDMTDLYTALHRRGVPVERVGRGDVLGVGEVTVEVMYPFHNDNADATSTNDDSVVMRIVYGERTFLLTGDIESAAEQELVSSGGTLHADVVKVAHHGSRTSSIPPFVSSANADFAVISVGRRSQFGHPHAEVVDRWQAAGASVIITGMNGMISVSTDGSDLVVTSFADQLKTGTGH